MKVWIASVLVLFVLVEFYQWAKHFSFPLPAFLVAGAILAIISNYDKYGGWLEQQRLIESNAKDVLTPPSAGGTNVSNWSSLASSSTNSPSTAKSSISFTIHRRTPKQASGKDS